MLRPSRTPYKSAGSGSCHQRRMSRAGVCQREQQFVDVGEAEVAGTGLRNVTAGASDVCSLRR